jgi:outer membrane immunogenic protein
MGASMRRSLITAVAGICVGISSAAFAADMALKAPPPAPLYDWTGWYGGVNAGYSWGRSRSTTTPNDPGIAGVVVTQTIDHHGWEASVEGGYCWQKPTTNFVACLEARYDFPRERSGSDTGGIPTTTTTIVTTTHFDPFLIGPHLGFLTNANQTMWYAAGGLAIGQVGGAAAANDGVGGVSTAIPSSRWEAGWFVGAGVEHMVDQHWSLKLEYDYVQLDGSGGTASYVGTNPQTNFTLRGTTPSPGTAAIGGHGYDNVMSVGINYHLH